MAQHEQVSAGGTDADDDESVKTDDTQLKLIVLEKDS